MALVDSSGRAVRSGSGRAIGSGSSSGNNNSSGDGRAANRARSSANLAAAKAAAARNAAAVETQRRNQDRQSQIKAAEVAQQQEIQAENQRVAEAAQKAENQRVAEAAQKAASKAKNKEDIVSARDRRERVPVGSAWSDGPPSVRSRDPLERLDRSSGRGMQNQGDAFYPTGFAESLEDNLPTGLSRGLFGSPMAAAASTVGKTFYNQHQYGMNKEAADLYKDLIADPANEGKTVKELVQMARKPQTDKYRAVEENKLNEMHKRGLIKDLNMSDTQWNSLPIEMKKHLTRDVNRNNLTVGSANQGDGGGGGGLIAGGIDPVEEESTYTNLDSYLKLFGNNTY